MWLTVFWKNILKIYYSRGRSGCFFTALFIDLVKNKFFISKMSIVLYVFYFLGKKMNSSENIGKTTKLIWIVCPKPSLLSPKRGFIGIWSYINNTPIIYDKIPLNDLGIMHRSHGHGPAEHWDSNVPGARSLTQTRSLLNLTVLGCPGGVPWIIPRSVTLSLWEAWTPKIIDSLTVFIGFNIKTLISLGFSRDL